jgi:FtsP/CotA-like multicopper oxidase with cupredoxin domain
MQSSHRIGLIVAAVVVLIVAFVVLGGGEDNTATTPTTPPAAETTGGEQAPDEPEEATPAPKPEPRVEEIRVPPSGDPPTLEYEKGDTVRLRVSAGGGESTEIHVHGYDKELEVPAGETRTLTFKANLEVEDHHTEKLLAKLEVRPS